MRKIILICGLICLGYAKLSYGADLETLSPIITGTWNFTTAVTAGSTVDGRDLSADGTKLDTINTSTGALATRTTALEAKDVTIATSTGTLATRVTSLEVSTGPLKTSITNLGTSTATLQTNINTTNVSTGTLRTETTTSTTTICSNINNLFTSTGAITTRVTNLETSTGSITTRVTNLETSTGTIQTQLSSVASSTGSIKTLLDSVATSTGTIQSGFVSNATTTLNMGGYELKTSSGILGLTHIVWADGTVQVSSPPAGGGSSGGGVIVATFTATIGIGGDVYISSNSYIPIPGATLLIENATWYITGLKAFTLNVSTVADTSFNLAYSSAIGTTNTWEYMITSSITVKVNTKYSEWITPDIDTDVPPYPSNLHLQTIQIPASGTLPSEYGIIVRYWRYLDR